VICIAKCMLEGTAVPGDCSRLLKLTAVQHKTRIRRVHSEQLSGDSRRKLLSIADSVRIDESLWGRQAGSPQTRS
jgi:hypothetical protein